MYARTLMALMLVLAAGMLIGCENPADNVPSATVTEAEPVDEAPMTTPEPTPAETEPAPAETEPAPETEPEMTEPATEPATETLAEEPAPAPAAEPTTLSFTDNSIIGFTGSKVTGKHSGGFVDFTGKVEMPDGTFDSAKITIEIDMTSLFSDDKTLTETLKGERFFEVDKYPKSKFVSTGVEKTADGYTIKGNLEMHGVTKGISFPATVSMEDGVLTSSSEFSIDRFQWGIEDTGMQDDLIRKEVVIQFEIEAA